MVTMTDDRDAPILDHDEWEDFEHQRWTFTTTGQSMSFLLRFSSNGGVSGLGVGLRDHSIHDVYGEWTNKGLNFHVNPRTKSGGLYQVQYQVSGQWDDDGEMSSVNGSMGVKMGDNPFTWRTGIRLERISKENTNKETVGTFQSKLGHYLNNSPMEKHFYDFTIRCADDVEVKGHKIILASQTKFFEGLFRQEQEKDFVLLDFTSETVKVCLKYLYTGQLKITGDNVQDLLMIANYLLISPLTTLCSDYILDNIDLTNCLEILSLADGTGNTRLMERALVLICTNIQEIAEKEKFRFVPVHLFRSILQSKKLLIRNSFGVILAGSAPAELIKVCDAYLQVSNLEQTERENLLELCRQNDRDMERVSWRSVEEFGCGSDHPRRERSFSCSGEGEKFIRKIMVKTVIWQGRVVIGGLDLTWSDGTEDRIGEGEVGARLEVPQGEHVSCVVGNSGWYVDHLVFISSSGRPLGPPCGGDGGSFRNSLCSLDGRYHGSLVYLDGVAGEEVVSEGVRLVTRLNFIYSILVRPSQGKPNFPFKLLS